MTRPHRVPSLIERAALVYDFDDVLRARAPIARSPIAPAPAADLSHIPPEFLAQAGADLDDVVHRLAPPAPAPSRSIGGCWRRTA